MSNQEQEPIALSDLSDKELDARNKKLFLREKRLSGELAVATTPTAKQEKASETLKRLNNGETGARRMIYDGSDIFQFKVPASMIDSVHRVVLERNLKGSTVLPERDREENTRDAQDLNSRYGDQLSSIAEREMKANQEQADDEVA